MKFEYLDKATEELLRNLISEEGLNNGKIYSGTEIEKLVKEGYIKGCDVQTMSDRNRTYQILGITQKGKIYFEQKVLENRELKRQKIREWGIPIVTAILGALIGYLLK